MSTTAPLTSTINRPRFVVFGAGIVLFVFMIVVAILFSVRFHKYFPAVWESCAVLATLFYCTIIFGNIFFFGNAIGSYLRERAKGILTLCVFASVVASGFICAFAFGPYSWVMPSIANQWIWLHALCIVFGAIAFSGVNLCIAHGGPTIVDSDCDAMALYIHERKCAKRAFLLVDLPSVLCFFVLFVFVLVMHLYNLNSPRLCVFLAGAVTFELVLANTVFCIDRLRLEEHYENA